MKEHNILDKSEVFAVITLIIGIILSLLFFAFKSSIPDITHIDYLESNYNLSEICYDFYETHRFEVSENTYFLYCITSNYEKKHVSYDKLSMWFKYEKGLDLDQEYYKYCEENNFKC